MMDDGELMVPLWPHYPPGIATVALYCDECGELYCEHRDERGRYVEDIEDRL